MGEPKVPPFLPLLSERKIAKLNQTQRGGENVRKLAVFGFSFSAAVVLCNYILPQSLWLVACRLCGLLLIPILLMGKGKKRLLASITCVGLALGFGWTQAYDALFFSLARELDDATVHLTATVLDYPTQRDYGWQVSARMKTEGGVSIDLVLYTDEQGADLRPGDVIESVTHLTLGTRSSAGEEITYYTAKGIFLWGKCCGLLEIDRPEQIPPRYWPAYLARMLKNGIDAAFPEKSAALVRAVVTGSREKLTDEFTSSLERTGLSHTVAVSGMHLSCFAGILALLLGRGKRSAAIIIGWALLFGAVAGNTPSVTRAAVMILLLHIAPLLKRERDDFTALGFALMLQFIQNPYAAAHVGLQLSFGAVAGILLVSDSLQNKLCEVFRLSTKRSDRRAVFALKRLGQGAVSVLSATLGAMVITTGMTSVHFGMLSLVSPLSNLMTLWAVTTIFAAGLAIGLLGLFLPGLAQILAIPVSWLAEYVQWCTDFFADLPFAALTFDSIFYKCWLVLAYVVVIAAFLERKKRRHILPACCVVCALFLSILCTALSFRSGELSVTALDVGQGQCILFHDADNVIVVDCGGDGREDPGELAADYLLSNAVTRLDALVLTHYHADHANGVLRLLDRMSIKRLFLPDVEEDDPLRQEILSLAGENGVEIFFVREAVVADFGSLALTIYPPLSGDRDENERGLALLAQSEEHSVLVTGDMDGLTERKLLHYADLPDIDLLIAGHHGSADSTTEQLLEVVQPELCIISVGQHNRYGHPADETLNRLTEANCDTYRTDQNGTVRITFDQP